MRIFDKAIVADMKFVVSAFLFIAITTVSFSQGLSTHITRDTSFLRPPTTFATVSGHTEKVEQLIPQNYYTQHLGFFCRQELKMQQAKVPVTFRLGSMEQCNRLEQKPGYR